MAILDVKKDGTGTHTTIQSAIFDAVDGDTVNIGPGTFNENVELYKSISLVGSGKDITVINGSLTSTSFTNCSWYAGEDIITTTSTNGMIRGRRLTATNFTTGSRISEIISPTQFRVSLATTTTGLISKASVSWAEGTTTITLPNTTSVVVGMKAKAIGVEGIITAINTTTKVITLDTPTTAAGTSLTLSLYPKRTAITATMPALFSGSIFAASIQVMNVATDGLQIKSMTVNGFDGATASEAAAIGISSPASGGVHKNWLIEDCKITANGDSALATSSNISSNNGTIQNCIFGGKTFVGDEPAEVPAFSSFTRTGTILSTTTLQMPSVTGIYGAVSVGSSITGTGIPSATVVTNVSDLVITLSKAITGNVGDEILCTFSNVQYTVPNVARQLVVIGNSSSVSACLNTTFKNNTIIGATGAVISATGNKSMFNTAVTIDTVGGLVENNILDGNFGAGDPNPLMSNFAIRSRGANVVVQNNTCYISNGRGNTGFFVPLGTSINNLLIDKLMLGVQQQEAGKPLVVEMDKQQLKSLPKISSDVYFSDDLNWKLVSFVYRKMSTLDRLCTAFRDFSAIRQKGLKSWMQAGDQFQLARIIISDANRQLLTVDRSELVNPEQYDFTVL